eukprot:Nk52_evm8s319 gene=Nk52_evmTU8s319
MLQIGILLYNGVSLKDVADIYSSFGYLAMGVAAGDRASEAPSSPALHPMEEQEGGDSSMDHVYRHAELLVLDLLESSAGLKQHQQPPRRAKSDGKGFLLTGKAANVFTIGAGHGKGGVKEAGKGGDPGMDHHNNSVGGGEASAIKSSCGVSVSPHYSFTSSSLPPMDVLFVPGGVGISKLAKEASLHAWIRTQGSSSSSSAPRVVSIQAGERILEMCGLTTGLSSLVDKAVSFGGVSASSSSSSGGASGSRILEQVLIIERAGVVVGKGPSNATDVTLFVVAKEFDISVALEVSRKLRVVWEPPRAVDVEEEARIYIPSLLDCSPPQMRRPSLKTKQFVADQFVQLISPGTEEVLIRAFEGIDVGNIIDYHCHRIQIGHDPYGEAFVNPKVLSRKHLKHFVKGRFISFAMGVEDINAEPTRVNQQSLEFMMSMLQNFIVDGTGKKASPKVCLLAFDAFHEEDGSRNTDKTEFYTSNEAVFKDYMLFPNNVIPVISVHPYRLDALQMLEKFYHNGARIVKWLPNSMGMDPSSPLCIPFFRFMAAKGMILLTHCGDEKAVSADSANQAFGSPLLLRQALDLGVTVIAAHCGSLGKNRDTEKLGSPLVENFDLWLRLMYEYDGSDAKKGILYGDISGILLLKRLQYVPILLENTQIHPRLLNGTDWPLPNVKLITSTKQMWWKGLITWDEHNALNEIFTYNPMLFDFVAKRIIRHPDRSKKHLKFSDSIFHLNKNVVPFNYPVYPGREKDGN